MSVQNPGTIDLGGSTQESGQSNAQSTQGEPSIWMTPASQGIENEGLGGAQQVQQVQQPQQVNPLAAMGLDKFQSFEALGEAYKNLERQYTSVNQEYTQIKPVYEQLIEKQLFGQNQQIPQQQVQQVNQVLDYMRMNREDFWNKVNESPHEVLPAVAKSVFEEQAKPLIDRLNQLEQNSTARFNMLDELQTQSRYINIKNQYSPVDPDFDANIQKAAQFLLSPQGKSFMTSNPGSALEMAYKTQLSERLLDPQWQQRMQQSLASQHQQQSQQLSTANPMTSSPNMSIPGHQPMVAPSPIPGKHEIAKNIAAFNEPFGLPNFNVI